MDIHTLYSDRTLRSGDGRSPHADLYCTFFKILKRFVLVYYIMCSHFQYNVTWVPNVCTAVHGNVYVHTLYIVLTCLLKLAPCLVINLAPSDEGTPAM